MWQTGRRMHFMCMEKIDWKQNKTKHQQNCTVIVLNLSKTRQMLSIVSSCNRHTSISVLSLDAFFGKGNVVFSAVFPLCLTEEKLWCALSKSYHLKAEQTFKSCVCCNMRSLGSLSPVGPCVRNSYSLGFSLITSLKLCNSEKWDTSSLCRAAKNCFFSDFSLCPYCKGPWGFREKKKEILGTQKRWGHH